MHPQIDFSLYERTNASDGRGERELFSQALDHATPEERAAFLDRACGQDVALRRRVEALLARHFEKDGFMALPGVQEQPPTPAETPHPTEQAGLPIGPYKLLEKLGEGGFGVVWAAEQLEPVKRRVALKIIKLGMDTKQVVARFEAERQTLALMDHPNIARVLDAGTTESGRPYFVMELVHGISITKYCGQEDLPTNDRLDLFIKVCHAIQHAHQKGIVHRDIKPSNILVTLHDGVPVPKVIDFGIAKATQGELTDKTIYTQFQQFIGTPAYMSPEQADLSGLDIDTRTDIYGLGVLLYELLTGSTPFDTRELMKSGLDEMRRIIREREPMRPSARLAQTGPSDRSAIAHRKSKIENDLDWIVMKCLEKDRNRRYDTANGLASDIQRHLADEPVVARPPSVAYRFQKTFHRNKLVFTAATAVALALTIGIVLSTWQAFRAQTNARRAFDAESKELQLRREAEARERVARDHLARQYLRQGQAYSERGEIIRGLHWFVRGLRETPTESVALRETIRENLARWGQMPMPRAVLTSDSMVRGIWITPDGQRVVTGNAEGQVQFWSVETGAPLEAGLRVKGSVHWVAIHPSDDSRLLVLSEDSLVWLWDARTGKTVGQPLTHDGPITSIEFCPDGTRIATAGTDGAVRLWRGTDGAPLDVRMVHEAGKTASASFSPDGRLVFSWDKDGVVRIWNSHTGEPHAPPLRHAPPPHREQLRSEFFVRFSPDGTRVMTAWSNDTVRLWVVGDGKPLGVPIRHDYLRLWCTAFSPDDGRRLLTGGNDRTSRLWDAWTGEPIGGPLLHPTNVSFVSFDPDRGTLLTGCEDGHIRFWSPETHDLIDTVFRHEEPVACFTMSGRTAVTRVAARQVALWNLPDSTPKPNETKSRFAKADVGGADATFDPDGRRVWLVDCDRFVSRWCPDTGALSRSFMSHDNWIWSLTLSPDEKRLLTTGTEGQGRLWSLPEERLLWSFSHDGEVRAGAFSRDGKLIATASFDGTARLWSSDTGQPVGPPLSHPGIVEDVVFHPNNDALIATACGDGGARLWSLKDGHQVGPTLTHQDSVLAVAFSPDGRIVATGGRDRMARFWDTETGRPGFVLEHQGWVEDLLFTRDGKRLVTVSPAKGIRLWSVETGEALGPVLDRSIGFHDVAWSRDGTRIAAASFDSPTQVWTLPPPTHLDLSNAELWVQVVTWTEMDEHGAMASLDWPTWQTRRAELEHLDALTAK